MPSKNAKLRQENLKSAHGQPRQLRNILSQNEKYEASCRQDLFKVLVQTPVLGGREVHLEKRFYLLVHRIYLNFRIQ